MKTIYRLLIGFLLASGYTQAQPDLTPDQLLGQAKQAAFTNKDFPQAITLCRQALKKSPDYQDIRIFLGRLYTWSDSLPQARQQFNLVLAKDSANSDALSAFTDLEYWHSEYQQALVYCNRALQYNPADNDLQLRKARILNSLKRTGEAYSMVAKLVQTNPGNADARALADQLKWAASKNMIMAGYGYLYFDKNYNDALHQLPWHLASVSYSRSSRLGSITGRLNYASRFGSDGVQLEVDLYPHISKTFYSYLNVGFSGHEPVFPRFRSGFSLYANLPRNIEAEVGFRYLKFNSETWIYTLSLGKYVKSFWFNARTFLVPVSSNISQTYIGTVRYYYGNADDFVSVSAGTGISPDETRNVLLEQDIRKLGSTRASLEVRKNFRKRWIPSVVASWFTEEQSNRPRGNQWGIDFVIRQRF